MGREGVSFCSLFKAAELFEPRQGDSEVLSPAGKARIDSAIVELGGVFSAVQSLLGVTLSLKHPVTTSRCPAAGAGLVRSYLHARFQLETQNIGTVSLRGVLPPVNAQE